MIDTVQYTVRSLVLASRTVDEVCAILELLALKIPGQCRRNLQQKGLEKVFTFDGNQPNL